MTWKATDPEGNETGKVRLELIPYTHGRGLDIGCGPWKVSAHAIGVDTIRYPGPSGVDVVADARDLSCFASESMDFVYSSHLLEHMEEPRKVLAEWWRLVKVGGYLVLYLPDRDLYPKMGEPGANPEHKSDFAPQDVINLMKEVNKSDWALLENQQRSGGMEYSFLQVYQKRAQGTGRIYPCNAPRPAKTAAVVRLGAYGDALWASSVIAHLKRDGYHVTVYTQEMGEEVLRHDPNIDRIIVQADYQLSNQELVGYWIWEGLKYDRWVNLIGSVESRLLPMPQDPQFYLPKGARDKLSAKNYLEAIHDMAEVPHIYLQKFYPTEEEKTWARAERAARPGPLVVIAPSGSSWPKFWPYSQPLAEELAKDGIYSVVLGDTRGQEITVPAEFSKVVGMTWPIRKALALALEADVVVGTESVMVNAVAFEPNLKIVALSHSSPDNLTRDWLNTFALEPVMPEGSPLECYPCHRIHVLPHYCTRENTTGTSACQALATPDKVLGIIREYLGIEVVKELEEAADAAVQ